MPRRQPRSEQRTQIDPFNAPDPIMPGDDEVVMEPDARAGRARHKTAEARTRPAESREAAVAASPSPAPSPKRPVAKRRRKKGAGADDPTSPWAKRASRMALRMVAALFAVIVIVNVVNIGGALVSSLSDAWASGTSDFDPYGDNDYYYDDDYDYEAAARAELAMETEASSRVEAELQAYVGADDAAVASAGESISLKIEGWTGVDPATLGVDATELARWALESSSYEMSDAYAFAEPDAGGFFIEGDVFYYLTAPDLDLVVDGLASLCQDELGAALGRGGLTARERALVSERLEALKADALAEPQERFLCAEFHGSATDEGDVEQVALDTNVPESHPF